MAFETDEIIAIMGKRDFKKARTEKHFEKLYEYFCNSGEMPYGIMKCRTGEPEVWIEDRIKYLIDFRKKIFSKRKIHAAIITT